LKHKDADLLRSLNSRAIAYRQLTLESLRLAVACRLLHIDALTSEVLALSKTETQQSTLSGVTPLLGAADKLGVWCGGLTTFEVATALHVSV
jgi:hypothetical protein